MKTTISSLLLTLILLGAALGAPPNILNYQGRVAVSGVNFDGTGQFKFALVNAGATETYWTNDGTNTGTPGGEPTAAVSLTVTKGLYAVGLGDTALANMTAVPASVFADHDEVYLRVWFDDGTNGNVLLAPDQRITSVGYALSAARAESLADGAVTEAMLADNAVTNAKIGNGAVNAAKLANNAVTSAKIAAGAVGSSDLAAGAVTDVKLASGAVTSASIADAAVTSAKIAPTFYGAAVPEGNVAVLNGSIESVSASVTFDRPFATVPDLTLPDGWSATTSQTGFSATFSFSPFTVDSGNIFLDTSMATVNGRPAIAYQEKLPGSSQRLNFAIGSDAKGTSWTVTPVLSGSFTAFRPSLAVIDGCPAVSYFEPLSQSINFVIAQDALGSTWGTPVVVATMANPTVIEQEDSALALVNGKPAICFHDIISGKLKYVISNDPRGASWGTPVIVDGSGGVSPSLVVVQGRPAIAYSNSSVLFYSRATDVTGSGWAAPAPVAAGGAGPTLAIVNGRPAVCHLNGPFLVYVRALDATGGAWSSNTTLDFCSQASLAVVGGRPTISYYGGGNTGRDIKILMAQDANGVSWGDEIVVDFNLAAPSGGFESGLVSMTAVDENVVLSYYDNEPPYSVKSAWFTRFGSWTARDSNQDSFLPTLSAGVVDGAISTSSIADGAVTSAGIEDGTIGAADLDPAIGLWSAGGGNVFRTSGDVGIGTDSPERPLHIQSALNGVIRVDRASDAAALILNRFDTADTSFAGVPWRSFTVGVAASDASTGDFVITDNTAGVSRLTIKQDGKVGIGTTTPSYQLQLSTDSAGKPNGGSWANSSDRRLKRNITTIPNALEKLQQLRGVSFEWVNPEDHANQTGPQGGFIAQEVEAAFPGWVTEVEAAEHDQTLTENGKIKSMSLPFEFDALVVNAIKEQQAQIENRDAEIAELKEEIAGLKAKDLARDNKLTAIENLLRERAPALMRTAVVKTGK